jgi:uncharacterized protein involved in exopolysaccharide biosynthesis
MELAQLSEDYDNFRAVLNSLVDKKLQADMSENLERKQKGEQFKVLDPASLPAKPFYPNRIRLVFLALVAGLGLGGGIVFLQDFLAPGVKSRAELKTVLGVPVLAVVPEIVTPGDRRRRWKVRFATVLSVAVLAVVAAGLVHVNVKPIPQAARELVSDVRSTHWTAMRYSNGR